MTLDKLTIVLHCFFLLLKSVELLLLRSTLHTSTFPSAWAGPCRDLWRGRCSKYERGTWNTAFNRAVLLADMCIEMDASVLIQQQIPWRRFEKETQNRKDHFKFKCLRHFLHLLITLEWYYYYYYCCCCYCVYRVWWFCCCKHYCCCCRKKIFILFKIEFYSNPVLKLFIFWMIMIIKTGLISIIRRKIRISPDNYFVLIIIFKALYVFKINTVIIVQSMNSF